MLYLIIKKSIVFKPYSLLVCGAPNIIIHCQLQITRENISGYKTKKRRKNNNNNNNIVLLKQTHFIFKMHQ